ADKPLWEKLSLCWHNHFATSLKKVGVGRYMMNQYKTLRGGAAGDFSALTLAVATDPAMMIWLDTRFNGKDGPNENFARELMERFTMGPGTFSESDVAESARCFTGWTIEGDGYRVDASHHDFGT